jgi:LmbE family N-acetylglucosaminyl deacetylase
VECLGYGDSGSDGSCRPGSFSAVDTLQAAARLARILIEESADVLTVYDRAGGYGHPDHVAVHHVGHAAARLAGTPVVLEATVDRDALLRAVAWGRRLRLPVQVRADAYTPRSQLTHRVDVRRHLAAMRGGWGAIASLAAGGSSVRTLKLLLRLPPPLFARLLGQEWFVESGRPPGPLCGDVFDSLRARK